jgi:U3 small nucleolar RNA-associated protein 10
VDLIRKIISSTPEEGLMVSALMALRTISLTMCPGEESSLVSTIPSVLAAIQGRKALAAAMTTLSPMV